jgi:hypothetical protein
MDRRIFMRGFVVCALLLPFQLISQDRQHSQKQRDASIARTLRESGTCVESGRVVLCVQSGALARETFASFLALAERGAESVRTYLGPHADMPGVGTRSVEIYVASNVGIPHVTALPEPWIFMHPDTIAQDMAPYLHEMVHVMAQWSWRKTEWIAEGFADFAASEIATTHGGYHRSFVLPRGLENLRELYASEAGQEMLPLIGVPGRRHAYTGEAASLFKKLMLNRRKYAPAYYALSWSFVDHLVRRVGLKGLRLIAESDDPSSVAVQLSGQSIEAHKTVWQSSVEASQAPRQR